MLQNICRKDHRRCRKDESYQDTLLVQLVLFFAYAGCSRKIAGNQSAGIALTVPGMRITSFGGGRKALSFGTQKINLHQYGQEFELKAKEPTPGSADLCFITAIPISNVIEHLGMNGVEILEGPIQRTGAAGTIKSVYFRDPDGNLVEVSNYEKE